MKIILHFNDKFKEFLEKLKQFLQKLKEFSEKVKVLPTPSWRSLRKKVQKKPELMQNRAIRPIQQIQPKIIQLYTSPQEI